MSFGRRMKIILTERFNTFFSQLEDHEALSKGALKDMAREIAEVENYVKKMKAHQLSLTSSRRLAEKSFHDLTQEIKSLSEEQSGKAASLAKLAMAKKRHTESLISQEVTLAADIQTHEERILHAQQRLHELAHKTHTLQARSSSNAAFAIGEDKGVFSAEHSLNQWETQIRSEELYASAYEGALPTTSISEEEVEVFLKSIRTAQ